ncbi:MAG: efflux RND transporter periplasmic adaptor subunit [Patescibacteria group bacterium]|nr:efflux RND transporter periplasmic adaptor subunit [Patescibacteria group bacterium]
MAQPPLTQKGLSGIYARVRRFIFAHKFWSTVIGLIILFVAWRVYASVTSTAGIPTYTLGNAQTGTLIVSVSGTGQVSASNELSLSPQAGGQIIYIGVTDGEEVAQGQLIAEVDPTNAQQSVQNAKISLQNAQLALEKLQEPPTALSLTQDEDAVTSAQSSLVTAYSNGTTDLANAFLDLPSIMSGLEDVDFGTETNKSDQWNIDYYDNAIAKYDATDAQTYRDDAYNSYQTANTSWTTTFNDYKSVDLATASTSTIQSLLTETYNTIGLITNAVKDSNALIQFYSDELTSNNLTTPSIATTQISNLATYTSKLATHSSALLGDTTTIQNDEGNLNVNTEALSQLQTGADPLDIQTDQIAVENAQNALTDAEQTLNNYYVTAPFSGTVGLDVTPYEQVGSGTTVATLVTNEELAEITLNEVDAATVKIGDQATLTFSALPNLTIAGTVADISPVGTVSQGVVTYTVKIGFANQNAQIKPGMSVSANIDTNVIANALMVPSGAVHTASDGSSYVLTFNPPLSSATSSTQVAASVQTSQTPVAIPVTIGATNDTSTQIISGLTQGEQVVVRSSSSVTPILTTSSGAGATRAGGGGGGGGRFIIGG